jgi:hypothetical protein
VPAEEGVAAQALPVTWRGAKCATRKQNSAYWFDTCYRWGYVRNDGDSRRDYFVFDQYGTCKSKGVWAMRYCGLGDQKKPGSPTGISWDDWSPGADSSGDCRTLGLSVSAGPGGGGVTFQACEKMDITKYAAAPMFSNYWRAGDKGWVYRSERKVRYLVSMAVAQGRTPPLDIWWKVGWILNNP